jgi:hypothetical protein
MARLHERSLIVQKTEEGSFLSHGIGRTSKNRKKLVLQEKKRKKAQLVAAPLFDRVYVATKGAGDGSISAHTSVSLSGKPKSA